MWQRQRPELHVLREREIHTCTCRRYFSKDFEVVCIELHGFCDTSESAYAGVVYIRAMNVDSAINHTALVIAKMKVAPIKRLSIPRLELCGALLVTKLLLHCGKILVVHLESTYTWTDITVVLGWLRGDPSQFKPFVGNQVAEILLSLRTDCRQIVGITFQDPETQQIVLRGVCILPNLPTTSCGGRVPVGYVFRHKTGHLHRSWMIVYGQMKRNPRHQKSHGWQSVISHL